MGVIQDTAKSCQSCSKSIAMLFPASECECVGGNEGYNEALSRGCQSCQQKYVKTECKILLFLQRLLLSIKL